MTKLKIKNITFIIIFLIMISFCLTACGKKMPPDLWILEWENAYIECQNAIPSLSPQDYSLTPAEIQFKTRERDTKVDRLLENKYPDLYKLKDEPEYRIKLLELQKEQKENAQRQFMQMMQQMQAQTMQMQQNSQDITNTMNQNYQNSLNRQSIDNNTYEVQRNNRILNSF